MTVSEPPAGWLANSTLARPAGPGPDSADDAATGALPVVGDSGPGAAAPAADWPGSEAGGETGAEAGGKGAPAAGDGPAGITLSDRLAALGQMAVIGAARSGPDGFSPRLLDDAQRMLRRVGERLRLSSEHTIVVLAGGTGSGKSSLFNRLAGADFSPVGVTRPTTRFQHACVWGADAAGHLLDWLGVPSRYRYSRASALSEGEQSLDGLVLLDLPDHDSVLSGPAGRVNQLISAADLMVWVLDPQKYADAAVHSRYLVPMAGHAAVIAAVLNQADQLSPGEAEDCASDLRRLLDSEGLPDARVLLTSAATGAGLDDLRQVLADTVFAQQAAAERIGADVAAVAARFQPYAGEAPPAVTGDKLGEALAKSAGVTGVGRALQSARELRAVDYVGWPISWLAGRITGRKQLRKLQLGNLWEELRSVAAGPAGAQQAEIDNALTSLADEAGSGLPDPWPATVRAATRSQAEAIPGALGAAISEALPPENHVVPWWRLVAGWQGLLLGCAVAAAAWIGLILAFGVFHAVSHVPVLFSDVVLLPWVAVMIAAILLLGWLTAVGCMTLVTRTATRERGQVEARMHEGVRQAAQRMVLGPLEQELAEYARFRENLGIALSPR